MNLEKTFARLRALVDGSAWTLILPALIGLVMLDAPMVKTLAHWSLYFLVLAGLVVIISRIVFPHIRLEEFTKEARRGDVACSIVVASVIGFVAVMVLSFVLWARPLG